MKTNSSNNKSILIFFPCFIFFSFFFSSCEKVIEFNGKETDPKLVVNGLISTENTIFIDVTKSRFFLETENYYDVVPDAEVLLFVDDVFKEKMTHLENGRYRSTYIPQVGNKIYLTIQHPTLGEVTCEETILPPVHIISLDTIVSQTTSPWGYIENNIHFKLKFTDPDRSENYYRLIVYSYSTDTNTPPGITPLINKNYVFSFDDIVAGKNTNTGSFLGEKETNKYNIFSNELFKGTEYTLSFSKKLESISFDEVKVESRIVVNLQRISRGYYMYMKTIEEQNNTLEIFSEPVQIYSNIKGGIGILGVHTDNALQLNFE